MNFNPHCIRSFNRHTDLPQALHFIGTCNQLTNFGGDLHPGDFTHTISNTLLGENLDKHIYLYETSHQLHAIILIYPPRFASFQIIIHPHNNDHDFTTNLLQWTEQTLQSTMQTANVPDTTISIEVMSNNTTRQQLLAANGYTSEPSPFMFNTIRSLTNTIPDSMLPDNFTIRDVLSEDDAPQLSDVHNNSFTPKWTPALYVKVMRAPGFHINRERVVVAPDGRFAAFLIYWLDPISKSGLFEPVGCHKDFRRLGLTKALMYSTMHLMRSAGMTHAIVNHQKPAANPASSALYRSVGFQQQHSISIYSKKI